MFLYLKINLKRYQPDPMFETIQEGSASAHKEGWQYLFKADSGLTKYYYSHPPNMVAYESLDLDSLKISQ
jgi:hypothetical protein